MYKKEYKNLVEEKNLAKNNVVKEYFLNSFTKVPLLLILADDLGKSSDDLDNDLIENEILKLLEGISTLPINVFVISKSILSKLPKKDLKLKSYSNVVFLDTKNIDLKNIFKACDMALIFNDSSVKTLKPVENGLILIAPHQLKGVKNYHPNDETGYSFTFSANNAWDFFYAISRAIETFKFPYDWLNMIKIMENDYNKNEK